MRNRSAVIFISSLTLVIGLLSFWLTGSDRSPTDFTSRPELTVSTRETVRPASLAPSSDPTVPADSISAQAAAPIIYGASQSKSEAGQEQEVLVAFDNWIASYLGATPTEAASLLPEGRKLATTRRAEMVRMIREDPEQALARAVSRRVQKLLPAEIQDELENHFDAHGDLEVLLVCSEDETHQKDQVSRFLTLPEGRLEAFIYGRREFQTTKQDLPVHGIKLGEVAALSEKPLRILSFDEAADVDKASGELILQIGEEQVSVESAEMAEVLEEKLIAAESAIGPDVFHSSNETSMPMANRGSWTVGEKRILYIRVDFSDRPGEPVSSMEASAAISEADAFFQENSEGQTSLTATILPATLRLPQTADEYKSAGYLQLRDDALAAARAFDQQNTGYGQFDPDSYDLHVLAFSTVFPGWSGRAVVGGRGIWLNGFFDAGITTHEIGHNYGVFHANAWEPSGNSPSGEGRHLEYADRFDVMGISSNVFSGEFRDGHFNSWFKSYLGWLQPDETLEITASGTYRLFRHDHPESAGLQAIQVHAGENQSYWLGIRGLFSSNSWFDNGIDVRRAHIMSGMMSSLGSQLMDMTPGSPEGFNDHPLEIGQPFLDFENGIEIRPLSAGGEGSGAYVDVKITLGNISAPIIHSQPTPQIGVEGASVSFQIVTVGTLPLEYQWLRDGIEIPGATENFLRFTDLNQNDGGSYSVRVTNTYGSATSQEALLTVVSPGTVLPGNVDPSFDPITGPNGPVYAISVQPDGRILIGGNFTHVNGVSRNRIARLHPDGSLDTSFDPGSGFDNVVWNLTLQPDGKILAGGVFTRFDGKTAGRIARLQPNGQLDNSFLIGTAADQAVRVIKIQEDGRILVGGAFTSFDNIPAAKLLRLHPDGLRDTSFDTGTGANGAIWSLAMHGETIYAGGTFSAMNGSSRSGIVRLFADGALDPSFTPGSGANGAVYALLTMKNGGVVAAGSFTSFNGKSVGRIVRLTAAGEVDPEFTETAGADDFIWSLALQSDGKILAAGWFTSFHSTERNGIARLSSNGSLDNSFDPGTGANDLVWPVTIQKDGSVLIGGRFVEVDGKARKRITRLFGDFSASSPSKTIANYTLWVEAEDLHEDDASPTADPAGWGIPNLLRYAFGLDSAHPDRTMLPQAGQSWSPTASGTEKNLTITFNRRKGASDLEYIAEGSSDLTTWKPLTSPEIIRIEDAGLAERVTIRDEVSSPGAARFLRVRVRLD